MSGLDTTAAWAASAALTGVTLIPLGTFWALNMPGRPGHRAQPVKMATLFLRIALPIFIMHVSKAVALDVFAPVVNAMMRNGRWRGSRAALAAAYTAITSTFGVVAASIATTSAVYLSGLSVLYVVLGRKKWWKYLRLDAICGAALLFVLDVAWWARGLAVLRSNDDDGISLDWLIVIVDVTLCLLAAGVVGIAFYVMPKLKKRTDLAVGNLSALLLSASILWLLRCTFVLSVHLKTVLRDWTDDEFAVQKFLLPILDLWVSATVLALVSCVLWNPVWLNPAAIPDHGPSQFVPGYYPPQYGYQQQPNMYQQYQTHQQYYPQQPDMYQQRPELSPTPVPAHRVYEAGGTPRAAELQGARTPQPARPSSLGHY